MSEKAGARLEEAKLEARQAFARNKSSTKELLKVTKDRAESFRTELWRGLLAVNGAGLATSATLISVVGFPESYLKISAAIYFIGLMAAAYSWGIGLGFSHWAEEITLSSRPYVMRSRECIEALSEDMGDIETRKEVSFLNRMNKAIRIHTMMATSLRIAHGAVPCASFCAGVLFALASAALIAGVMAFDGSASETEMIRISIRG